MWWWCSSSSSSAAADFASDSVISSSFSIYRDLLWVLQLTAEFEVVELIIRRLVENDLILLEIPRQQAADSDVPTEPALAVHPNFVVEE
jgi:hypothetical protein